MERNSNPFIQDVTLRAGFI